MPARGSWSTDRTDGVDSRRTRRHHVAGLDVEVRCSLGRASEPRVFRLASRARSPNPTQGRSITPGCRQLHASRQQRQHATQRVGVVAGPSLADASAIVRDQTLPGNVQSVMWPEGGSSSGFGPGVEPHLKQLYRRGGVPTEERRHRSTAPRTNIAVSVARGRHRPLGRTPPPARRPSS